VVLVVEHHEEDRADSVAVVVEHHADAVDPLDVAAAASAVEEEVVVSAAVEAAAVSQEAVVVAVVLAADVDEEDTKCVDLGRIPSCSDGNAGAQPPALPSQFGPTITYRYHDHLAAFWSCDGFWCTMSNIWRPVANSSRGVHGFSYMVKLRMQNAKAVFNVWNAPLTPCFPRILCFQFKLSSVPVQQLCHHFRMRYKDSEGPPAKHL
jgi:hypothetical protein